MSAETDLHGRVHVSSMTRVCLVGERNQQLSYELLSRETARDALAAYDRREPYHNTVAVETVSLGAAVSLLNDLAWYLARFTRAAMVLEPSVSETEWLSRPLATAIRDGAVDPAETGRLLRLYGLQYPDREAATAGDDPAHGSEPTESTEPGGVPADGDPHAGGGPPRLVEPMFVARTGGGLPEYDLRDVDGTLRVRVTAAEFED